VINAVISTALSIKTADAKNKSFYPFTTGIHGILLMPNSVYRFSNAKLDIIGLIYAKNFKILAHCLRMCLDMHFCTTQHGF
jgi:hypothetical protein